VPSTKDDEKRPLLLERKKAQAAKGMWAAIGGLTVIYHGAISHLTGVPPDLTVSPAALGVVMVAVVQRQEDGVNQILDDPPRDDYLTPTKAKSRRYVIGRLGVGDLALAVDNAALAILHYTAYLEATVRADERGQGARLAGDEVAAADREYEAGVFIERARAANVSKAGALNDLALAWARFGTAPRVGGEPTADPNASRGSSGAAVGRSRLVVKDLGLDRQITAAARSVEEAGGKEVGTLDELVLSTIDQTLGWSAASLEFYADARSNLAAELVAQRRRQGERTRSVAEVEFENEGIERGLADWRRGDIDGAWKTFEEISERVDLYYRLRGPSVPLLEDAREPGTRGLRPARGRNDSEEE
jgi:hypothetical protein